MPFAKGDKVELTEDYDFHEPGDCGVVDKVIEGPGHVMIRLTHKGPACTPVDGPTVGPVPQNILQACHC